MTDVEILDRFLDDCQIRNMDGLSIVCYKYGISRFLEYLKKTHKTVLDCDNNEIRDYIRYCRMERKLTQKTIENYLSYISSMYDFLVYDGIKNRNPIPAVRKRYLTQYKNNESVSNKYVPSIEEMSKFLNSIVDVRDKAIAVLFAKTGIRRKELIAIDLDDIDWSRQSFILKPTKKRTNRAMFFDDECAMVLKRWLKRREQLQPPKECKALFIGNEKERLRRSGVYNRIKWWADSYGLKDFHPHAFRHWFTTHMRRNGMPRSFIQELRGDSREKEAIDIYDHIDQEELRKAYLSCVPLFGV
jgi:integrase/recombinase XerD